MPKIETPAVGPRWLLPTNIRNLLYWQAAGLILPEWAMTKYAADVLHAMPGWIPLFRDSVPESTLDAGTAGLGAVLLDVDVSQLSGSMLALTTIGEVLSVSASAHAPDNLVALLVPAPLPIRLARRAIFADKRVRDGYRMRREEVSNVPSSEILLDIGNPPLAIDFANLRHGWIPEQSVSPPAGWDSRSVLTEGAVMALAYAFANVSAEAVDLARAAFEIGPKRLLAEGGTFRRCVDGLLAASVRPDVAEQRSRLYWSFVDCVLSPPAVAGVETRVEQAVLDLLGRHADEDLNGGQKLRELRRDLEQISGLGSATFRELWDRHPGPLSHALLLFFLRREMDELLHFDLPNIQLSSTDRLAASILFAAREGWLRVPLSVRNIRGLDAAISDRMARRAHEMAGIDLSLGNPVPRCRPIREVLTPTGPGFGREQLDAALELVRGMKWSDALETRISLGKGSYQIEVTTTGMHLVLPGEAKAVQVSVVTESLLARIATQGSRIPADLEQRVRELAGDSQ